LICRQCSYAIQPGAVARYLKEIHHLHHLSCRAFIDYASIFELAQPNDVVLPNENIYLSCGPHRIYWPWMILWMFLPQICHRRVDKTDVYTVGVLGEIAPPFQKFKHDKHALKRKIVAASFTLTNLKHSRVRLMSAFSNGRTYWLRGLLKLAKKWILLLGRSEWTP
jgi:hypothetical protein